MKKTCVVTGAAGGIGKEVVRKFVNEGYRVVLIDLVQIRLEQTITELGYDESQTVCYAADITDEQQVKETVKRIRDQFESIDVLVNAAGICGSYARTEDYGYDNFRKIYEVNVFGTFLMMANILPVMREQNSGAIINFGSCSGMRGYSLEIGYGSSKWAVIGMTENVAVEYGQYNIRCNSVSPGWILTEMTTRTLEDYKKQGKTDYDLSPMDRAGQPEEVADVVYYLASDQATYINGANLTVDGGKTAY